MSPWGDYRGERTQPLTFCTNILIDKVFCCGRPQHASDHPPSITPYPSLAPDFGNSALFTLFGRMSHFVDLFYKFSWKLRENRHFSGIFGQYLAYLGHIWAQKCKNLKGGSRIWEGGYQAIFITSQHIRIHLKSYHHFIPQPNSFIVHLYFGIFYLTFGFCIWLLEYCFWLVVFICGLLSLCVSVLALDFMLLMLSFILSSWRKL